MDPSQRIQQLELEVRTQREKSAALIIKVASYMEQNGEALAAADKLLAETQQKQAAARKQAEKVGQRMVQLKLITADEQSTALEKLAGHPETIQVLDRVLTELAERTTSFEQKLAASHGPGRAVPEEKSAGVLATPQRARITGDYRPGLGERTAADSAMLSMLGIGS